MLSIYHFSGIKEHPKMGFESVMESSPDLYLEDIPSQQDGEDKKNAQKTKKKHQRNQREVKQTKAAKKKTNSSQESKRNPIKIKLKKKGNI